MSVELKQIVSKNITRLRVACKMTQLELGQALSYSDKAVSKWERGEAIPDAYVLLEMSKLFGVTVDYLLTEHEDGEIPSELTHSQTNHAVVALIAISGIFMLASLIYVILSFVDINHPLTFMYATTISLIVLTVMNTMWGKRIWNLFIISAMIWSIILMLYMLLSAFSAEWWKILFLGIPAQVIVCLCFRVKRERRHFHILRKKNGTDEK